MLKVKTAMPKFDRAKRIILLILVIFIVGSAQEIKDYIGERPAMPSFPAPSLRMKALGDDFLGIVSDLETDVLYFPSLLPFLKSNQIGIIFSPEKWNERGTACLNLMFPRTFIPRVGLGFQNQLRFYSSNPVFYHSDFSEYDPYSNYFSHFSSNNFGAYQQSIFLSFLITQSFIFAPFYTFITSPYQEERVSYDEYGYDTLNYHRRQANNKMNNDITENEFGLSLALKMKENLLHIAASVKNGKNEIDGKNEDQWSDFYTNEYFYEYDSSYSSYNLYQDSIHQLIRHTEDKTGKGKEQNLKIRWQNETKGKFNLIMDLMKISTDLEGQEVDTSYFNRWSYYFRRWGYPNQESTETDYDTSLEYYHNLRVISGKMKDLEISLAGGYEFVLDKAINSYVGFKSVFAFSKDSIYKINEEISGVDTTSQTDSAKTFLIMKVKAINLSLPIGLEYQITKPVVVRAGIAPKFNYEKREYKDEKRDYPVGSGISVSFGSSFGLGFIINPRFSIDLYNNGNLFSLGEWLVQGRYRF